MALLVIGGLVIIILMFIQDATESTARVELHSKCQTVSVDRTRIAIVGGSAKVRQSIRVTSSRSILIVILIIY